MVRTALARVFGVALAIPLFAAAAGAQSVHEVVPGGDAVSGDISASSEVDRVPVRLVEGAVFSLSLKAAKGSLLLPDLVILGPDRKPDPSVAAYLKVNSKGNVLAVKNLPVPATGLRWIEVRGKNGTTGGWLLSTKVKYPKGTAGAPTVGAAQGTTSFQFPCPGNATATITVAAAKGSPAIPAYGGLVDPAGAVLIVDEVLPGKTGFSVKNVLLARPGTYVLALQPGTGGDGAVNVTVKWKIPKPVKRALLEAQVITDPVATALSPASGNTAQAVPVTVTVDFARPGAKVHFRKPPTVVTAQGLGLTVGPTSISFLQSLASFQKGEYDVEVENPDGGKSVLVKAFTVVNAPATLTGVTPNSGYDNQSAVRVTVSGAFINGGATAALVRGAETIPGTSVSAVSNSLAATFDLTGHAIGFFDVVVTNPDAAPASLASAFEIVNSPPVVTAISPAHNIDSVVVACTIDGSDIDAPPTAALRKAGQADIPGTSVVRVSGSQVTCSLDTTGRAVGAWDVVVTNPDGRSGTLAGAFLVTGAVAPAAKVLTPGNTADGPPSVCWNGTRDEILVGWLDENAGSYDVLIQRLSASGTPQGSPVSVSTATSTVPKRDVRVAWDSTNDQYLVVWAEMVPISGLSTLHPSYGYSSVYSIFAQRFQGSDLSALGSNVQVTSHLVFSGYYMDEFNNFRPDACWNPTAAAWEIVWMQEWSTQNINGYGYDDWDVLKRTLDANSSLGAAYTGVATSQYHEGEPSIVYNPVTKGTVTAWNYRGSISSPLSGVVANATLVTDSSDTQDLRMAVDPDGGRLLLTWTKTPSGSPRFVQGAVAGLSSTSSVVGSIVTIASGGEDHFLASPIYNPALKQALVAWTRKDGSGGLTVRSRRATTATAAGLVLVGGEIVTSSGSTDEAMPASVCSATAGESVVVWLKTMSFVGVNGYPGSTFNGIYRGKELWMVRYR